MKRIIEYFYIFSKLTTSLVLIIIIFIMGYALLRSYKNIDKDVVGLENDYDMLSSGLVQNINNFKILDEQINQINLNIDQINKNLEKYDPSITEEKYRNDINNLINLNKELENKIDNFIKNQLINDVAADTSNNQVLSVINLIIIKYKNGENFDQEFSYLETIIPIEKIEILEKINIIKLKNFLGFTNLKNEFDTATKEYINSKFLNSNKNSVIKFLFNFITISPSNLTIYEKEELNLLMSAKKDLEKEDLNSSLKIILSLDTNQQFFDKWINQVNIYLDFINQIQRAV